MYGQCLDSAAVLNGGVDAFRKLANMRCTASADSAHLAVFNDLRFELGQLDDLVDVLALTQGVAAMALLPTCGAKASDAQ